MIKTSKSAWIWFPGDREIWLGNLFNNRRTERGAMFPPFWKQDSHWQTVEFSKQFTLSKPETIRIFAEGAYNFMLDGKLQFGEPKSFIIPEGLHKINIKVHNLSAPPSLLIESEREGSPLETNDTWLVTCEDKIWIDENGQAHGSGIYLQPGCWPGCNQPEVLPSKFSLLETEPRQAVRRSLIDGNARQLLFDFGQETMGYLVLHNAQGSIHIYYGESEAEALDKDHCETLDHLDLYMREKQYVLKDSKAFRFVRVEGEVENVSMLYEYLPHDTSRSGRFECSDPLVNKIWKVGAYTMDLTTREFMMDGIKRDRWTWSGDAIQSYLMNYYLRFDSEAVKRTIRQLRGKDPVTSHINTILDYTFYWFNSLGDYYRFTGDVAFIREMYPRMKTQMDYTLSRLSSEGLAMGQPDDWIFVDWVDFPMHKRGILCFEQILLAKSLETMQLCATLAGDKKRNYGKMATELRKKIDQIFWDASVHAYLHALEPELNRQVTKFPNMFSIFYGYASDERCQEILQHVMLNPEVPAINTPYMRFYELAALGQMGLQEKVLHEIKDYWGGMLLEGATSFWEKYNPNENDNRSDSQIPSSPRAPHLEMYGRPYGKSLCHAWGASPVFLLGRYFLGVRPLQPGYGGADSRQKDIAWEARPCLGGLEWMRGDVPTPYGKIHIEVDAYTLTVSTPQGIGRGIIYYNNVQTEVKPGQTLTLQL
ncbi:MAG: alpha-rhamnosidase [Bacteroidales bacterium]|nr:alpha-rhamnosidase [Bacteroidales bacterium]